MSFGGFTAASQVATITVMEGSDNGYSTALEMRHPYGICGFESHPLRH